MSGGSPSSIKSFYKAKIHNNNGNSEKSSYKRSLDSNNNNSVKIPRTFDCDPDVFTLEDSEDDDPLTNEFSFRGVSTPSSGVLSFGTEKAFNASEDASKSKLFQIFFLKSQNSDALRSAYNSLARKVFDPRWIDLSEVDKIISTQKNPILILDSFESSEFSCLKSKKSLKIFSAFALLSIKPKRSGDLTSFKHSCIASVCMKKVSLTYSGIKDHSLLAEIRDKVRAMGGIFKRGLHARTTHIVATNWNSDKVKYFRKTNKPVVLPEWVLGCWEKREDIIDIKELDDFALPVFAGMNICVSGFDQQTRKKMNKNVIAYGGNWQSGLLLERYDFDTEDPLVTPIENSKKTTHLVVAAKKGEKYKAAMSNSEVKIVNLDWFNVSQINGVPQMEDDPKYCLRDDNALNELKRLEREMKKRQLQSCSQNNATQDNSSPVLSPKNDVFSCVANSCSTAMISSTGVFDGLSFCFCGLSQKYHQNVNRIITRLKGTVYNELVPEVTHVIIGPNMSSCDAYNINRHEEKYQSIEKVDLDWVNKCFDNGALFPTFFDKKLEDFLDQFKSTQDLPPNVAKEIIYKRALESADEFTKEIDFAEKLNHSINFNKKKKKNSQNSQNGSTMCDIPISSKLEIAKDHCSQRASTTASIPVGWGSQTSN